MEKEDVWNGNCDEVIIVNILTDQADQISAAR